MRNNQNDCLLNSQIAQFYDTQEQRQLLSSYNAPSISPLVNYQLQIHRNFAENDTSMQLDSQEEWSILTHLTKSIDEDKVPFISDAINIYDEKSINNALDDISARISIIQRKE